MRQVRVLVLTPYLSESLEDSQTRYGYDPDNLNQDFQDQNGHKMVMVSPEYHGAGRFEITWIDPDISLVIAGSTREGENEVRLHKESGLIFARYSIFYGGESDYTGNTPEDAGYALDFPKSVATVKSFLTSERILSALVKRKEELIWEVIAEFNTQQDRPVLITPYLHEVLTA